MRDYLKKNWLNILMAILAALGGADAVAGVRSGKSPTNLTVLPSILAALGASGVLGTRWLNNRVVTSRPVRRGVPPEILEQLEDVFGVAESPDVTAEHAGHLADMAAAILLGHYRRAQQKLLADRVKVVDQLTIPGPADRLAAIEQEINRLKGDKVDGGPQQ